MGMVLTVLGADDLSLIITADISAEGVSSMDSGDVLSASDSHLFISLHLNNSCKHSAAHCDVNSFKISRDRKDPLAPQLQGRIRDANALHATAPRSSMISGNISAARK